MIRQPLFFEGSICEDKQNFVEIIKENDAQLIFKVKSSKEALYVYWSVLIVVNIFAVVLFVIIYGLGAIWVLSFLLAFDLIFLKGTKRTYTVAIDKFKDTLEVRKDDRVIYVSYYPLQEIKCVKTVVSPHFWNRIISSLVIILSNNEEEIIETARQTRHRRLPFYIDIHANSQAKIGKKMAEFLSVTYLDSEYTSS